MPAAIPGKTMLIVDDEHAFRIALARALSVYGWRVQTCGDGEKALLLLAAGYRPDVILLDQELPLIDGRQVLAAIRANPGFAELRVIRMSAHPWPNPETPFLEKPFEMAALLALLNSP